MSEPDLERDLDAIRLREHARFAGAALLFSILFPYEIDGGRSLFLWQSIGDLPFASALVAVAPPLAGLVLIVASSACSRLTTLLFTALGTVVIPPLLVWSTGPWALADSSAGIAHRMAPSILALGLIVAALHGHAGRTSPRIVRIVLGCGTFFALLIFAWPWPNEPFAATLSRVVFQFAGTSKRGNVLPILLLTPFAVWPIAASLIGWGVVGWTPPRTRSLPALVTLLGVPAFVFPLASETLVGKGESLRELLPVVGVLVALAASLTLLAHGASFWVKWRHVLAPDAFERKKLRTAIAVVTLVVLSPCLLALRASPDHAWRLGPRSAEGDRFFGKTLSAWNDARADEDLRGSPAKSVAVGDLLDVARALDPKLGEATDDLVRATTRDDLTQRRWDRLIARTNEASRRAALPYYIDPTEAVASADGSRRWFRIDTYGIERVRKFRLGSSEYATLDLRWMTPDRSSHHVLGLSRDIQTFALVVVDEVDEYESELEVMAAKPQARCVLEPGSGPTIETAITRCGALLTELLAAPDHRAALLSAVERHELQHQIDGASLPLAGVVSEWMRQESRSSQIKVSRELSAYLAQMTSGGNSARMTLVRLLRFAAMGGRSDEARVANLALQALAGQPIEGSRESVARAFLALLDIEEDALSRLACEVWRAQFGHDLERPVPLE